MKRLLALVCLLAAAAPAHASPPLPLDLAGFSLTVDVPDTYKAGAPIAVSGQLLGYAHLPIVFEASQPVAGQDVQIYVDGAASKTVRTDSNGMYATTLVFDAAPPTTRAVRAVAFGGTLLETSSPSAETRLSRILIDLRISPSSLSLGVSESADLVAIGTFDDGRTEDVTDEATWSSSDVSVATVSDTPGYRGTVSGAGAGSAVITADIDGTSATASAWVH